MSKPHNSLTRREFLQTATLSGLGFWLGLGNVTTPAAPNSRLNVGVIGTINRAAINLAGVRGENIVGLCDIDDHFLAATARQFPRAKTFSDFRKLIEMPGLDAVVISTPDHTHAPATLMALQAGKHVYCEKPLTHTVREARRIAEVAAKTKVATQMGIQIHAERNYRRVVEMIQADAIGSVHEVHVVCSKTWSGGERPSAAPPVPRTLHFDLWLGPAPARPYNPIYLPENWRRWWDFGGGTLGDMGCHYMDLVHWALDLRHPIAVSAEGPPPHPETTPTWLIAHYEYPARGAKPPVKVSWYDGGKRPALMNEGLVPTYKNGVLFVGEKGMLFADYRQRVLLPEAQFESYEPPAPTIPDSPGHYAEWIQACKNGGTTSCNFDYSAALTESVLLGNVAYRAGRRIEWDAAQLKVTNYPQANQYLHRDYRAGWAL